MLPGDFDPAIGELLFDKMKDKYDNLPADSNLREYYANGQDLFSAQAEIMQRGSRDTPWWGYSLQDIDAGNMTYECDENLGTPAVLDCLKLDYARLPAVNSTINVGPEEATFLSSGE